MSGGLIRAFQTNTLVIEREGEGEWINGRYEPGPKCRFEVIASVQPMKASEMLLMPEGERTTEHIKVYTNERLREVDEKNTALGDKFAYDGKCYEVQQVENWQIGTDLPHYKAICKKVTGQGGGERVS